MQHLRYSIIAAILVAVLVAPALSQSGTSASYTQIGISPRTIGIGNAYVAGGAEGVFTHHNPALASWTRTTQIDLSGSSMSFNRSLASVQAVLPLPPSAGLAIDLLYAGVRGFDGRTQSGYHTEEFNTHDLQLGASFGLQISNRFSLGTRITYRTMRYTLTGLDTPSSIGLDVGFRFLLREHTSVGFAAQDLIGEFVWDSSDFYGAAGSRQTTDRMPMRLKAGLWHQFQFSMPLNVYAEIENRILRGESVYFTTAYSGTRPVIQQRREEVTFTRQYYRIGTSLELDERLKARLGWQSGDSDQLYSAQRFSAGFTLSLPFDLYAPEIDYAVQREPHGITWMHMFAIRLNLTP